jgi:PKD repeat protein
MLLKRLLVIPIIVSLVTGNFLPVVAAAATNVKNTKGVLSVSSTSANLPDPDWSLIDWDQEVVLPQDFSAYQQKMAELSALRAEEAIKNLSLPKHKIGDEEVMSQYRVPKDIQEMVRQYRDIVSEKNLDQSRIKMEKEFLAQSIRSAHPYADIKKDDNSDLEKVIDLCTAPKIHPKRIIPYNVNNFTANPIKVEIKNRFRARQSDLNLDKVSSRGIREQADAMIDNWKKRNKSQANLGDYLRAWLGVESVQAGTPIIASYTGIEKYPTDNALYYLSTQQNTDGSFGRSNQYETTAEVVFTLSDFNLTNNDQYTAAVNYLKNTTVSNIREKAIKARVLVGLGLPYQALLDEIIAQKNKDGGYGLQPRYASDVETSAQVAWALWVGNYSIADALPKVLLFITNSIPADGAMRYTPNSNPSYYLINFTAQYLYPFKTLTIAGDGGVQISIQNKINTLLNYLNSQYDATQERLLGADRAIDESMTALTWKIYQVNLDKAVVLNKNVLSGQAADGSFDQEIKSTLSAVRARAQGDLVLVDLVSTGNLVNKSTGSFILTIKNRGLVTVSTGTIYFFADGYFDGIKIDLKSQGVVIAPNETVTMSFNIGDMAGYFGDTEIRLYLENEGDLNYDDNWIAKNFNFASSPDGMPAMPMYYMAGKHVIGTTPNLNVRWGKVKSDPNRKNYAIMWREKGTTQWNYYAINNTWNGAFIGGAFNDGTTYEVTAGVLHNDGSTLTYFTNFTDVKTGAKDIDYLGTIAGYATLDNVKFGDTYIYGFGVNGKVDSNGNFIIPSVPNGSSLAMVQAYQYDGLYSRFPVAINATTTDIRMFSHLKADAVAPVNNGTELRWATTYKVKNQQEYTLLTFGSDNVSIKDGDFYLWSPTEQLWRFLGTAAVSNSGSNYVEMKWYVPTDLPLGTGYKIKGNLRDYRGNESAFKEWGPFEIIDGTTPTFNITSPNGGETFILGATNTISWTSSSTGGVPKVNLYLEYPDSYTTLVSNISNSGNYSWSIPLNSSYVGNKFKIRVRGADAKNYLEGIDNSDNYFTISDPSSKPADPWAMPQYILDNNTSTASISRDQYTVEYDSSGTAHAVYRYVEDYLTQSPRIVKERLLYLKYQNGVWTEPIVIYEKVWQTDGNLTGYRPITSLKMKIAGANPHLMWQSAGGSGGCSSFNDQEIYYYNFDGSKWVGPNNLSNNSTESRDPNFVVDSAGNTSAVWLDGTTWNDSCQISGNRTINFVTKSLSGNWSAISNLNLDQYPSYPLLATTADNKLHLVYKAGSENKVRHTSKSGSIWSSSIVVSTSSVDMPILKSEGNDLHYVFREYYQDPVLGKGRSRVMYVKFDGTNWAPNEEVSPIINDMSAEYPKLAIAGQSKAQIIFQHYNSNTGKTNLVWTTKLANGKWLSPQAINLASQNYFNSDAVSVAGSGNNLIAVWPSNYSYQPQMVFNTADLNLDYTWPEMVSGVQVASAKKSVVINWPAYQDVYKDFDHFNIYRALVAVSSTTGLSSLAVVTNVSTTSYIDTSVQINQQYYYTVTAVDKSGHESAPEKFVGPIAGDFALPPSGVTASVVAGMAPLAVQFDLSVGSDVGYLPDPINFNNYSLISGGGVLDSNPKYEVQTGGNTLYLSGMTYKKINFNYQITTSTVLEFDFKDTAGQAALHGIGFETPTNTVGLRTFQLYGWGAPGWTILNYNNYKPSDWKHYKIEVGKYYTGAASNLFFINRGDLTTNSFFKNIRVYEDKYDFSFAWDVDGDGATDYTSKAPYHIYKTAGNFSASVKISDGISVTTSKLNIDVTPAPVLDVVATSSVIAGTAPLAVQFDASVPNFVSFLPSPLNFNDYSFTSINNSNLDNNTGKISTEDNGKTIRISGLFAKSINFGYNLTPDSVVEFDFKSTGNQAALDGFSFETPSNTVGNRTFQIYGFGGPGWTILNYNNYKPSDWKHYKIPVGAFYTAQATKLIFFNRGDVTTNGYFRNFRIYEKPSTKYNFSWDINNDGQFDYSEKSPYHIYSSTGTFKATLKVSDGITEVVKNINIDVSSPPVLNLSATSSIISGGIPLTAQFDVSASGLFSFISEPINFNNYSITTGYAPLDYNPKYEVQAGGNTLYLSGMTFKQINFNYNITNDTMLEFDFKDTAGQAALHGIGFNTPTNTVGLRTFQLYGWGAPGWTILNYNNYKPSDWKHYKIPIGAFFTGSADKIFFINRGDLTTNSFFRNVRLYEKVDSKYTFAWDMEGDGKVDYTEKNPVHIFPSAGTYNSTIKVSDGSSTQTAQITTLVQ